MGLIHFMFDFTAALLGLGCFSAGMAMLAVMLHGDGWKDAILRRICVTLIVVGFLVLWATWRVHQ